jgi:hypothetical protein
MVGEFLFPFCELEPVVLFDLNAFVVAAKIAFWQSFFLSYYNALLLLI